MNIEYITSRCEVITETGCWIWTGSLSSSGYGLAGTTHNCGKRKSAHRVAYELLIGEIPSGLCLDHLCRVRSCVNPSHLEPVTIKENNRRSACISSINSNKTYCKNGHEFSGNNLKYRNKMNSSRVCLECARKSGREFARKKRKSRAADECQAQVNLLLDSWPK